MVRIRDKSILPFLCVCLWMFVSSCDVDRFLDVMCTYTSGCMCVDACGG